MLKLGPKKLANSTSWDEVDKSQVVQLLISHEQDKINSFQFVYVVKADVHHSQTYGEPNCLNFNTVTFDYPSEFLVSVSGRYEDGKLVSSNAQKYGLSAPYRETYKFNYEFGPKSSFGGFHGSVYNGCLCTIGVYVNPVKSVDELTV